MVILGNTNHTAVLEFQEYRIMLIVRYNVYASLSRIIPDLSPKYYLLSTFTPPRYFRIFRAFFVSL